MHLLLLQHAPWVPAMGGASRSNRFLLEGLAARGHTCRVIAPAVRPADERHGPEATRARLREELAARGVSVDEATDDVARFRMNGVTVEALTASSGLHGHLRRLLRETAPTHVLVSCEDPFHLGLEVAVDEAPERTIYLARTTQALPFGPASSLPDPRLASLVARAGAIVATSDHVRDYVRRHAGLESTTLHSPLYGEVVPPPRPGDGEHVLMINPCAYKGLPIFLGLARRFPEVRFAAVKGWGTTAADEAALRALPNVTVLPHTDDIEALYAGARVLLVPSLWDEAFGAVCVEAMLRGVPVIASDAGGLPEAALGTAIVAPVRPIEAYEARLDERRLPIAVVPEQDLGPWAEALAGLLDDPARARALGRRSREAAARFVAGITIDRYERWFAGCFDGRVPAAAAAGTAREGDLSRERLALLAAWIRARRRPEAREPAAEPVSRALVADARLDPAVRPSAPPSGAMDRVFLTGATGFLGGYLLRELLARTDADVHCLVRADDPDDARQRLLAALRAAGGDPGWARRVVAVSGALDRPRLGLSARRWAALAEGIDLVVHNGAQVQFAWPYEALRPANVDGTREIVRLACEGPAKPLHLVSTLAVFPAGLAAEAAVDEAAPPAPPEALVGGYARTKWVAEAIVREAAERGLPVAIHRPSILGGHGITGRWSTGDLVCRVIRASAAVGAFPNLDRPVYIAPVDYVASGIVALAAAGARGPHHHLNPRPFPLAALGAWLDAAGWPVALVPYEAWLDRIGAAVSGPAAELAAMLPHLRPFAEDQLFASPRFDGARTAGRLEALGVTCPPTTGETFRRALGWLAGQGALPAVRPSAERRMPCASP